MKIEPPTDFRWSNLHDDSTRLFGLEEIVHRDVGIGLFAGVEFLEIEAKSIINKVPKESRLPFAHTINVYRGCTHACTYCFARPTHAYLNLGIGHDFETKIVVKTNAVERVRAELASARWDHSPVAMGTNTDPYQLAEGKYHLTKGVIGELVAADNPFSILTKSTLILRDLSLLSQAAKHLPITVNFSIGTLDRDVWKLTEPGTPPPERRLAALTRLRDAGLDCGVLMAPILPGLSDSEEQLRELAQACVDAGATSITALALHLRPGVREHYFDWLGTARPDLVALHRERFIKGAYQSRQTQDRIDAIVKPVSASLHLPRVRLAPSTAPVQPAPSSGLEQGEQLSLL